MNTLLKPIAFDETSYNVAVLHKILKALGLPVAEEEVAQHKAGQDTRAKVRALQARLNVPVSEATLVNEATVVAVTGALQAGGLAAANRSFTVSGTVRLQDGSAKQRQQLLAFDLDLRGVAVYRNVETVADIQGSSGFEFLGVTSSDNHGHYGLTFYDWQYPQAERKKADVVVYAVEEDGPNGGRIVGRSRLVNSDDYSEKGLVSGLDVYINQRGGPTEYEIVMQALNTFLNESETTLRAIAASSEQLAFTAGELDLKRECVEIAARAELLMEQEGERLSHELLYGIGRQNVSLDWAVLVKKQEEELLAAIAKSVAERIIRAFAEPDVREFLKALRELAAQHVLNDNAGESNSLNAMLSNALPDEKQRLSFINAVSTFKGSDFQDFWSNHLPAQPEFADQPQLVSNLLLTQQLTLLTGNHQALVKKLQVERKLESISSLLELEEDTWLDLIGEAGVPDFVKGEDDEARSRNYAGMMRNMLNAAFPTQRIALMLKTDQLPIENTVVAQSIFKFLFANDDFDFAASRVHDYGEKIEAAAGAKSGEVKSELLKLQRVFQISTTPEAMTALLQHNLHSAYTVANIPRKSFMKTYGDALGGEQAAFAIHQRASHIATKNEVAAAQLIEYTHGLIPGYVMGAAELNGVTTLLQNKLPNYAELFGSPDICECEHCRSVYSAAAYFVDLLRFLWRGQPNSDGATPLDMLAARRPDLLHLPLTCENTNTIIPYIDLANEVMEYYTANDSLTNFEGYDTGEASAAELRANPQNFNLEAYLKLKDAKYPFTLPYHQPLDVIRTYSDHLKVSRYEVMKAMNPEPETATANAIAAESLRLSEEERKVLTGKSFDGTVDATPVHQYYGYTAAGQLEGMSAVPEFLRRSGMAYGELVELVETRVINPNQGILNFLEKFFSYSSLDASTIYARLKQIEAGTLDPSADADIMATLNAYNSAQGADITATEFKQWVTDNLGEFRQVITLYEPDSKCALEKTKLRTIQRIYEGPATSGLTSQHWIKIHRFTRLWRKLGWRIHETDLMLAALEETVIGVNTIGKLEAVSLLKASSKLAINQLAVLWGNIDTYGDKSLYKKLFLNKAVQQIDGAFKSDAWGSYLQDAGEVLADHQSAILAAFRMRDEDLTAILEVARVIDGGSPRPLDLATDVLNLANLSTIYRHVVLSKALKMSVTEVCKLMALFDVSPFSTWNIQQQTFTNIAPDETFEFYQLAASVKKSGFKAVVLEYILQGTLPADSTIGLSQDKVLQTAKNIREAFSAIEQNHPETPPEPLTTEILAAKLALTFRAEIVSRFTDIIERTASFETVTDKNLDLDMSDELAEKYTYLEGSGRLTYVGVMTDDERAALKGLANDVDVAPDFGAAVDRLYNAPESFVATNFDGIFGNLAEANEILLDHPAQTPAATFEEQLAYVYEHFIPLLKSKLRRDAITQHIAALIGLGEEATALLIAQDIEQLIADLSTEGFSATYFGDATWTTSVLEQTDAAIDFDWGASSPGAAGQDDNFSASWAAYIAAPASDEYTLLVDVKEADEVFRLYLDNTLLLEKDGGDTSTSWEVLTTLNAAQMHVLKLDYAEAAQNAGVRLQWKTATTALDVIPPEFAYPSAILDAFAALTTVYHRAAKFISGFKLSETELAHLINFNADFDNLDFRSLDAQHWRRVNDYTALRNAVPQAQAQLIDVFAAANTANPAPTVSNLRTILHQATAWDEASLEFLVDTHFGLSVNDFKNEIALKRLLDVMQIIFRTGLSSQTIAVWGTEETDFDALNDTAQLIKNAVKAKYEEEDWLELAGNLSDKIRENQKQALIGYLLTRKEVQDWGAVDADGLFEYFLIDVQMGACMDTSRVVQANSSVQMFVNRCLLNLESDLSSGSEKGVSPGAVDKDRWEWMKYYRVWEANRKVFLYPENWLEPEWRNDRSEFFKELESYLVQNDITERSVEEGFRNYLASLNEVANLDVCGMHRENQEGSDKLKYLHVFARTHNGPYKYFYRRWNEDQKWSAWERVPVDIRGVEVAGLIGADHSGAQLIPVVWKKRLFLFWPEFLQISEAPGGVTSKTAEEAAEADMSWTEAVKMLEIRLGWSEYVDGKWTPKHVSKEYVREWPMDDTPSEREFLLTASISPATQELTIVISETDWNLERGKFTLPDIQSAMCAEHFFDATADIDSNYQYRFSKRKAFNEKLQLMDDTYLQNPTTHMLLPVDTFKGLDITLENPFFFCDAYRTYFVRPVPITIFPVLKSPDKYKPYLPDLVDDSKYYMPFEIPPLIGPDNYIPVETVLPGFSGGFSTINYSVNESMMSQPLFSGMTEPLFSGMTESVNAGTQAQRATEQSPNGQAARGGGESQMATAYVLDTSSIAQAFGGAISHADAWGIPVTLRYDEGLEFHTFYHPYSSVYVKNLNQGGLPGLMQSDTSLPSDEGETFEDTYDPYFTNGFVQKPADFDTRTYYKENVCFDVYGANSMYNWELFFHAPLYIATRLSKNGKYEEAMKWFHFIFDPTTDEMPGAGETETSRYWKVLPFKNPPDKSLEELLPNTNPLIENATIKEWRDNPFDPHLIAANRPLAYMKHVVIKYVENLIAWGDSLFRQDTMETVHEALQIYVIANHILGPRPQFVPKRGEIKAESYESLKDKWDDFSNALVELENIFPYSSEASVSDSSAGTTLLGVGPALYFCIPANEKLMEYWDTVTDRLFKIRHCQNIEGVERKLALFAPPIDPAALIQAASQGLSLGSILADLSSPPPIYRFTFLIQKANEFCADVKTLGMALLAALEKKDAEEFARLRASHEAQMLELMTAVRERQVLDARANKESLEKARETASFRLRHYVDLLGNDAVTVPAPPTVSATLTDESQLPADTALAVIETDVDESLVASDESGVKLIPKEKEEIDSINTARDWQIAAQASEGMAAIFHIFPTASADAKPIGVGAGVSFGGTQLGNAASAGGKVLDFISGFSAHGANMAAKMAAYIRREQDWTLQANLAAKEIIQLDKQITAADIRIQVAEKELENHEKQIEHAKEVELFLKDKFTNQELYQWMKEQLFAVYKQSYNLAYDIAKKAEKAYKYEMGTEVASFIQYGYWDNSKQGLVAGEKLQLALRQLEKAYLEDNRRELELTKSISLARLDPLALIELRETGTCYVSLPEELFDLDFRGHYFRRIKSARLSLPCVAGPYTSINCSLRLLNNSVRINTSMNSGGTYGHENDDGLLIDDDRFRTSHVPVTAIATSSAQNDSGMFEFNFRDERYLPFERAGAISEWQIELSTDEELRQFDYSTISDVILHLDYTARESGGLFKKSAATYIKAFITNAAGLIEQPLRHMFSMKHEFPTEWHRFLHPIVEGAEQVLSFTLGKKRLPFFAQDRDVVVMKIEVFSKCTQKTAYKMVLSYTSSEAKAVAFTDVDVPQNAKYGGINKVTLIVDDLELEIKGPDIMKEMKLKLRRGGASDYASLVTTPEEEVEDIFFVIHYRLAS